MASKGRGISIHGHNTPFSRRLWRPRPRSKLICLLSCSRHTVAFAPQLGRVYTFGLGAYGQLGSGETMSCSSPVVAKGPWMTSSSTSRGNETSVMKIVAGGDHCFVLSTKAGVSCLIPPKVHFHSRKISTDRKISENIIVKSWKFSTSKFFSDGKFLSASHILQNFLSAGNFPQWQWTLTMLVGSFLDLRW